MADDTESLHLAEMTTGAFVPIAEAMPAMLWIGDSDGRCVYLNKALREFWGVEAADIPRFTWSSTLLEEDAPALFSTFTDAMAQRRTFTVSARYRRADGAMRRLLTKAEPRFAPNGEFLGMVGINIDVTDEKAAQA